MTWGRNSQIKGYSGDWGTLRKIVKCIYFLPQRYIFVDQIYKTKMVQYNQMISENQNEGEIAKLRWLRHIKGDSEIWNISSSNSQNQIFQTKMVWQWQCTCHGMYILGNFKNFTEFFLLIIHYLLSKSPSLSASFGLVY